MVFPGVRINTLEVVHNVGIILVVIDLDKGAVAAKLHLFSAEDQEKLHL